MIFGAVFLYTSRPREQIERFMGNRKWGTDMPASRRELDQTAFVRLTENDWSPVTHLNLLHRFEGDSIFSERTAVSALRRRTEESVSQTDRQCIKRCWDAAWHYAQVPELLFMHMIYSFTSKKVNCIKVCLTFLQQSDETAPLSFVFLFSTQQRSIPLARDTSQRFTAKLPKGFFYYSQYILSSFQ